MAYSDQQQRDERGRFASNGGPSTARAERVALNKALDQRNRTNTRVWDQPQHNVSTMQNITHGLLNKYGGNAPGESRVREVMAAAAETGAHIRSRMMATVPPRERPGLFITRNCKELLRTLQSLPRDPKKADDCPSKAEDHLPDTLRYILGKSFEPHISTSRRQVF